MSAAEWRRDAATARDEIAPPGRAADAVAALPAAGHRAVIDGRDVRVVVDDELVIDIRICLPNCDAGRRFWRVRTRRRARGQVMLVARLDEANVRVGYCLVDRSRVQGQCGFRLPVDRARRL